MRRADLARPSTANRFNAASFGKVDVRVDLVWKRKSTLLGRRAVLICSVADQFQKTIDHWRRNQSSIFTAGERVERFRNGRRISSIDRSKLHIHRGQRVGNLVLLADVTDVLTPWRLHEALARFVFRCRRGETLVLSCDSRKDTTLWVAMRTEFPQAPRHESERAIADGGTVCRHVFFGNTPVTEGRSPRRPHICFAVSSLGPVDGKKTPGLSFCVYRFPNPPGGSRF